jgi:hypothetical protein
MKRSISARHEAWVLMAEAMLAVCLLVLIGRGADLVWAQCSGAGGDPSGCSGIGDYGPNPLDGGGGGDGCSPIIVSLKGDDFHLTSASGGVKFDIGGTGHPIQIAWTVMG